MRCVRHLEDEHGSLIEVLYYGCRLCFTEEPDPEFATLDGGWWPCLDAELATAQPCRVCGELMGSLEVSPSDRSLRC